MLESGKVKRADFSAWHNKSNIFDKRLGYFY